MQNATFHTPGKMGRVRSNSRVAPYGIATAHTHTHAHAHPHPYNRHGRSDSVSSAVSTSLSVSNGQSQPPQPQTQPQYWTSPSQNIEKGFTNMSIGNRPQRASLHHRRTSSRNSANWPSITATSHPHSHSHGHGHTKSLTSPRSTHRIKQSVSMSTLPFSGGRGDNLSDIPIPRHISVTDRSTYVQQALSERAQSIHKIANAAQQDKARSLWVRQWLRLCYLETTKDISVPRQGLFASYEQSCREYGVKAINAASFGKAVRGAYPKIITRRLGKRGDSKYHYIALGPSIATEAKRLNEYDTSRG